MEVLMGGGLAFLATLAGSFAGGGMSLLLLPLLLLAVPGPYGSLLATCKISALTMNVVAGSIHRDHHTFHRALFAIITIAGLIGTAVGTFLMQRVVAESFLRTLIGIVLLCTVAVILRLRSLGLHTHMKPLTPGLLAASGVFCLFINVLNGLIGGTGVFTTIFFVWALHMTFIEATAYGMLSYFFVNIMQAGYLTYSEGIDLPMTAGVVCGAVIGSFLGTHLQYLKGNVWVKRASILMMAAIGSKMLLA